MSAVFDRDCRRCERLAGFLDQVSERHPGYYCRPVPPFGDPAAKLLIVGLAPGMHGANKSGRPFTGDYAGILLYETLHKFGFGTAPASESADDDLELINCRITNAVKCLPPDNKPTPGEREACRPFLERELATLLPDARAVVALGGFAYGQLMRVLQATGWAVPRPRPPFGHGAEVELDRPQSAAPLTVLASYHPSQQNTNTGRLTRPMFDRVFRRARTILDG